MSYFGAIKFDTPDGVEQVHVDGDGYLRVMNEDVRIAIAEDEKPGKEVWRMLGFTPTVVAATESDVWSKAGLYTFPAAPMQMQLKSSVVTVDTGAVIKGNAEGAAQTIVGDPDGSTTALTDADVDFTAGTSVAVGDCVLLDPKGTTPEYGYVTGLTGIHQVDVAGGFSKGGSAAGRAYTIIDVSPAANTGLHAVEIDYLTSAYVEKCIIVCLNGNTGVNIMDALGNNLTDIYRVNYIEAVAAGANKKAGGNISLTDTVPTVTYGYITAGFTRSRAGIYTVPYNKYLYIDSICLGYGQASNQPQYARVYLRSNGDQHNTFRSEMIFHPIVELLAQNESAIKQLGVPIIIGPTMDVKVSILGTYAGIATVYAAGWVETI